MTTHNPAVSENLIVAAIEAAQEIRDPLDGLVEKTAADPGAPFAPDTVERLATLKKEDRHLPLRGEGRRRSLFPSDRRRKVYRSEKPDRGQRTKLLGRSSCGS
jgi:hypothetical protein